MRVVELKDELDGFGFQVAVVDSNGIRKEVRLDLVDTPPAEGDYLIVHAGFAIHRLSVEDAESTLKLFREAVELEKGVAGGKVEEL